MPKICSTTLSGLVLSSLLLAVWGAVITPPVSRRELLHSDRIVLDTRNYASIKARTTIIGAVRAFSVSRADTNTRHTKVVIVLGLPEVVTVGGIAILSRGVFGEVIRKSKERRIGIQIIGQTYGVKMYYPRVKAFMYAEVRLWEPDNQESISPVPVPRDCMVHDLEEHTAVRLKEDLYEVKARREELASWRERIASDPQRGRLPQPHTNS